MKGYDKEELKNIKFVWTRYGFDDIYYVKIGKAKKAQSTNLLPCPDCGEKTLRPEGKCNICSSCGYSKCS